MAEPTDATLKAWISPATASFTPEEIAAYQDAVAHAVTQLAKANSPDLVSLAFQIGRPEAKTWLTEVIRAKKADFVAVDNDELLSRVACCIAVRSLESGRGVSTLIGLLVQSAIYTGASEPTGELVGHANVAVHNAAIAVRQRPPSWKPISAEIASLLVEPPAEVPEGAAPAPDGYEKALGRLAEAVDTLGAQTDRYANTIDEEYGALWWSYSDMSTTTNERWAEVKPLDRRVVLTAHELGGQLIQHPGPPMIRGLLAAALGNQANKSVTLGDIALAAVRETVNVAPMAKNRLLPISSSVAQIIELGSANDTWRDVINQSLGLTADTTTTALEAALQLLREVEIGYFLV